MTKFLNGFKQFKFTFYHWRMVMNGSPPPRPLYWELSYGDANYEWLMKNDQTN
jgi:hypothetical protein